MDKKKLKLAIGIGGASGAIYSKLLLDRLASIKDQLEEVSITLSKNALINWKLELGTFDASTYPFDFYEADDFNAPFASGSAKYDAMIICPCSAGILGRIASGVSTNLMTRGADVMLKERKKLILMLRETPLSLIHINNMKTVTEAGAIVCPIIPSFYSNPQTPEEVAMTVIDRTLDLVGLEIDTFRWGN